MSAEVQGSYIPFGTPLMNSDGTRVLARFKTMVGIKPDMGRFRWPIKSKARPDHYEVKGTDPVTGDIVMVELSATCVFYTPQVQVWFIDQPDDEFDQDQFSRFFPDDVFTTPADPFGMEVADAITTLLEHDYTAQMLKWPPEIGSHLESYRDYLTKKGTHHVG